MGAVHSNDSHPNYEQKNPENVGALPTQGELLKKAHQAARDEAAGAVSNDPTKPRLDLPKGAAGAADVETDLSDISSMPLDPVLAAEVARTRQMMAAYDAGADSPILDPAEEMPAGSPGLNEAVARMAQTPELLNAVAEANGGPSAPRQSRHSRLEAWFAGTSITALTIAFQQMSKTMSKQSAFDIENYRLYRLSMKETVEKQAQLAIDEGNLKSDSHLAQQEQKNYAKWAGIVTMLGTVAVSGGWSAVAKFGLGQAADFQEKFKTVSGISEGFSKSLIAGSEADMHGKQVDIERGIGANQAQQAIKRDQYDNFKGFHDRAIQQAAAEHEQITRTMEALQQTLQRAFQIGNIGRS